VFLVLIADFYVQSLNNAISYNKTKTDAFN